LLTGFGIYFDHRGIRPGPPLDTDMRDWTALVDLMGYRHPAELV
jgi:hypothetical protein